MITSKVVRKTYIDLNKMANELKGPSAVKVGFPEGEADSDVIERATFNNFGTKRGIPERSFMQNAMRNNKSKYRDMMKAEAKAIVEAAAKGQNVEKALARSLKRLGIRAQGDIQEEITSLQTPPNAPSTVKQKGSSNPLIDTGEMRKSVTYKIED